MSERSRSFDHATGLAAGGDTVAAIRIFGDLVNSADDVWRYRAAVASAALQRSSDDGDDAVRSLCDKALSSSLKRGAEFESCVLGDLLVGMHRYSDAVAAYGLAVDDPRHGERATAGLNAIAVTFTRRGEYERARTALAAVPGADPGTGETRRAQRNRTILEKAPRANLLELTGVAALFVALLAASSVWLMVNVPDIEYTVLGGGRLLVSVVEWTAVLIVGFFLLLSAFTVGEWLVVALAVGIPSGVVALIDPVFRSYFFDDRTSTFAQFGFNAENYVSLALTLLPFLLAGTVHLFRRHRAWRRELVGLG